MFIHVVAVDKQYSVHAEEKKSLGKAVDEAFKAHSKKRSAAHKATNSKGKKLDLNKPVKGQVKDGEVIYVS